MLQIKKMDRNGAGTISRDEFVGFMVAKKWKAKADSHIAEKLRQEGLAALEKLSKGNREKRAQIRERSEGVPPDAPVTSTDSPGRSAPFVTAPCQHVPYVDPPGAAGATTVTRARQLAESFPSFRKDTHSWM